MKGVWQWLFNGMARLLRGKPKSRGVRPEEFDERKALAGQFRRAQRAKESHPWFLLSSGPTEEPCPVHAPDFGLVLPVDDPYWKRYPLRRQPGCKCRVRQVSKREFEQLKRDGVQVPASEETAIRNENGRLTGHHRDIRMPIKTKPAPRRS